MQSTNAFSSVIDTFVSPTKAFNGLKQAKGWTWFAIVLFLLLSAAVQAVYYKSVDQAFFVEQQMIVIEASGDMNPAQIEQTEAMTAQQFPMMWIITSVSTLIFMPIVLCVFALYYHLVAKQDTSQSFTFGDWFSFSTYTSLPAIISALGSLVLILTASSGEIPVSVMTFASLNQLIFGFEPGHAFTTLLESINIFSIWSIALAYVGLKSWTNFSQNKALLFALLPSVLIYGIWAIVAAL